MNKQLFSLAADIIGKANRENPADAVLRSELKNAKGISRKDAGIISEAVFAYYRWFGWVDQNAPMPEKLEREVELEKEFHINPRGNSDVELQKAVPEWVAEQLKVLPEWLRALQMKPALWLRARVGQG